MKYLMLCFAMLIGLSSCKKEELESKLPPETTTGKNTAGFIVDGKIVVLPKDSFSSVPGSGTSYGLNCQFGTNFGNTGDDFLNIRITNSGDNEVYSLYITFDNLRKGVGEYIVGQNNGEYFEDSPNHPQITLIKSIDNKNQWYYSSEDSGIINMTRVDTKNDYYAGTFQCSLYNKDNPNEIITITEGRFDIYNKTLNK